MCLDYFKVNSSGQDEQMEVFIADPDDWASRTFAPLPDTAGDENSFQMHPSGSCRPAFCRIFYFDAFSSKFCQ